MSNYDNEMKIAIWPNKNKTNPKAPPYTGTVTIEGVQYGLSIWSNKEKHAQNPNAPILRGSVQRLEQKPKQQFDDF